MDTNRKLTDITDRKPRTPSYKYSFRLNEEQHIRFNELLCKAGLEHNRSRFIVKRIFAEEFVVIRRDPSKVQFIARLNDFYFQFQKLGNNYNQIVKRMASVKVKFRASSVADREGRLFYQIIHNRVTRQISSGHKLFPSEWEVL